MLRRAVRPDGQCGGELFAAATDPTGDRVAVDAEEVRDLGEGESVDVAEQDGDALSRRQARERLTHLLTQAATGHRFVDAGRDAEAPLKERVAQWDQAGAA